MRRIGIRFVLLFVLLAVCLPVPVVEAFWGGSDYLVEINDVKFTEEDYRHWWNEWQDPGMAVHESLDEYIDFMLLAQEAEDMQLTENPSYKKKLLVFLKVRALMQLKGEEIDAKKQIPAKEELWDAYVKEYTPKMDLQMIAVQEEEQADVIKGFMDAGVPFSELTSAAGLKEIAEQVDATGPMRYTRIPEQLRDAVLTLQQDQHAGPVLFGHAWYFVKVLERQEGTEEDFETVKQSLIRKSLKQQEYQLTQQLMERLLEQGEVVIDRDLIATIGPDGPAAEDADKIAITIGSLKVPASFLYASVLKTQKTRGMAKRNAEDFDESKKRIVDDILVQTLTEREAMARHYEQIPPLKYVFDFYSRYRLIKEFEESVVRPEVKVTDEDIEAYYKENPGRFSQEGMIEYAMVTTNESELASKISQQLKQGEDFFTIMEPISPSGVKIEKKPLAQLQPVIQEAITPLASGQIATVVEGKNTHFVKVVRSAEKQVVALDMVRDMITETVKKERFKEVRDSYLKRLREHSVIKQDQGAWKTLRKQLQEENATNES